MSAESTTNNGWGAYKNAKKELEILKSKINETKDNKDIMKENNEEKNENDIIKHIILKKKSEIKELIVESETKKEELIKKIQRLNDEFKEYEKVNNEMIGKIMQKIDLYKEMLSDEKDIQKKGKQNHQDDKKFDDEFKNEIFVGSLKETIRDVELFEFFKHHGDIDRCRILTNLVDGKVKTKCCGFVRFKSKESAINIINSIKGTFTPLSKYPLHLEFSKSYRKEGDQDIYNDYNVMISR